MIGYIGDPLELIIEIVNKYSKVIKIEIIQTWLKSLGLLYINIDLVVSQKDDNKAVFLMNLCALTFAKEFGWEILDQLQVLKDSLLMRLVKNMNSFLLGPNSQMAICNLIHLLGHFVTQKELDFSLIKLYVEKISLMLEF